MGNILVSAYVLLTVKTGREYDVVDEIKKRVPMNKIRDISIVYGMFDIVIAVDAHSLGDLERIVLEIRKIPYVSSTTTLVSACLLYTSPSPRDLSTSRMPSSA